MGQASEFSSYLQTSRRPSSAAQQASRPATASGHGTTASDSQQSKKDKGAAALELWNKWAQDALGPLSSDPTDSELKQKSKRLQGVIRQSERLSASVSRRISSMAEVRAEINVLSESSSAVALTLPTKSARKTVIASRSSARSSMNDFVRAEGRREAAVKEPQPSDSPRGSCYGGKSGALGQVAADRPQTAPATGPVSSRDLVQITMERDSLRTSFRAAQMETAIQLDEKAELLATIDLLRAKLHAQVIDRLEFLENDKLGSYNQLLESQSEITRLEKALRDAKQAQATREQEKENDFQAKMSKLQKRLVEARSEVETLGMELRATQARQESSQTLSNSVINLYNKMHDNSEVMKQRPVSKDDLPVTEPLHMVQCIYELMRMHSVTATGMMLHDLSQVCNRIWATHFNERSTIKGDIFATVLALEEAAGIIVKRISRLEGRLRESNANVKRLSEEKGKMERTANALRTEHDRRDQLTRQSVRTVKQRTPLPGAKCPTCHEVVGVPHRGEAERASTASAAGMSKGRTEGGQPPVRPTTADAAPGRPATPPSRPVTPITRPSTAKTQAGAGATPRGAALRGSAGMSRSVGAPSGGPRGAHWEAIDRAGATGSIDFSSEASAMLESSASWAESSPARRASVAAPGALAAKMSSVFLEVDAASAAKMAKKLQL
eukprot:jgi/Tetstr1/440358/TSEL_028694.t1